MRGRWLLEGAGAAVLLMLPYFYPLLLPGRISLFHHHLPMNHILGGILLDLAGFSLLGAALLMAASRLPEKVRIVLGASLAGLACWRAIGDGAILLSLSGPKMVVGATKLSPVQAIPWGDTQWVRSAHIVEAAIILTLGTLAWLKPRITQRFVRATRVTLASVSFCVLWILPQLMAPVFCRRNDRSLVPLPAQAESGQRRIVWILFDELSHNLVFDHVPRGVTFPNFEKLRSRSISFTNLQPEGFYTDRVIPSLLLGVSIHEIRSGEDGRLWYFDAARQEWLAYNAHQSLFGLAQDNGWNPAVAGWYNPYCRIFASVLTACFWQPSIETLLPFEQLGATENQSAAADAMLAPRMFWHALTQGGGYGIDLLRKNIEDYRCVMAHAQSLIGYGQIHFIFIHLPVPHPPGIYDRRTHQLREGGDYLDNLALADDTMGRLMQQINSTPWAAQTTVIVSSDHSWRVPIWRHFGWSAEEERTAAGSFDQRPVFLVHFPGEGIGDEITGSVPELAEHDMIAAMLQSRYNRPEQLVESVRAESRNIAQK